MAAIITHKEYSIEVKAVEGTDMWRTHIRRLDGAKIKITANDKIVSEAIMPDEWTADKATEQAKRSIDAGGFSKAP